jgi:hypothetical protein
MSHRAVWSRLVPFTLSAVLLASCSEHPPVYTVRTEVTSEGAVIRTPQVTSVAKLRRKVAAPGPRVFAEETTHDFGRMDPRSSGRHAFTIRNRGEAPLELAAGRSSCKCQLASVSSRHIAPGGSGQIVVDWNTGEESDYSHTANVLTNDPLNPVLRFTIRGKVLALLRCEPETLVYSRVTPGEIPSATTLVYSQVWDAVDFPRITSSHAGFSWSLTPGTPAELDALHARSAYRLTVTLPADLAESYFHETIELEAHPADGTETDGITCRLAVEGVVLRRLCVYGPDIDVRGTLLLGRVSQGEGKQVRLLMKLRDEQRELPVRSLTCSPEFLSARVEPYSGQSRGDLGLYHLHVEVPQDAPPFHLPPYEYGSIRIEFDHPRVPVLELPVDLNVMPCEEP